MIINDDYCHYFLINVICIRTTPHHAGIGPDEWFYWIVYSAYGEDLSYGQWSCGQ